MKLNNKDNAANQLLDMFTGLPTKPLFLDRLRMNMAYCRRFAMSTAVCYLRIIFPAEINSNEGKGLESFLKNLIVTRLKQCVREIDTIGVANSTDFIILLT